MADPKLFSRGLVRTRDHKIIGVVALFIGGFFSRALVDKVRLFSFISLGSTKLRVDRRTWDVRRRDGNPRLNRILLVLGSCKEQEIDPSLNPPPSSLRPILCCSFSEFGFHNSMSITSPSAHF